MNTCAGPDRHHFGSLSHRPAPDRACRPGAADRRRALRVAALVSLTLLAVLAILCAQPAPASAGEPAWVAPAAGPPHVMAAFDGPSEPWLAGHRGVDLAARLGDAVLAAGEGVVTFSGLVAGRGVVTIAHGQLRTTYEPLASAVSAGQRVRQGQLIGIISVGGHCSARCLHWGLRRGSEYLDPMLLLHRRPPVLKPLPPIFGTARDGGGRSAPSADGASGTGPADGSGPADGTPAMAGTGVGTARLAGGDNDAREPGGSGLVLAGIAATGLIGVGAAGIGARSRRRTGVDSRRRG